jgi:lysophospholipase L1-like esterase
MSQSRNAAPNQSSRPATTESRPRGRWLLRNLVLGLAGLAVSLVLCELLLRLLGVGYAVYVWTDPVRGVAHIPGAKGGARLANGHRQIEINSDGWRGPEIPLQHPPGTLRIALLGDSFIEAFEVPFEQTVGEVIARRLSAERRQPVQVLNFGEGGYGTAQELLTLQHEVWKYSPDLVLLAITTGNDISDNYRPLKKADNVPYFVFRGSNLVLDTTFRRAKGYRSRALWTRRLLFVVQHSRLAQLVNRVRHIQRKESLRAADAAGVPGDEVGLRSEVHVPPTTPQWQEAWRVTEGILRLMRDECRKKNTPFLVVTLTRAIQVTPDADRKARFLRQLGTKDLFYPERRLDEFGRREGIPVLNLAPTMAQEAEQRRVYFHAAQGSQGIGHWNAAGHEAAGELIAEWLGRELSHPSATNPEPRAASP